MVEVFLTKSSAKNVTEYHFSFEVLNCAKSSQQFLTTFNGLPFSCLTFFMQELVYIVHTHRERCKQVSQTPPKQSLIAVNQTTQSLFHKLAFFFLFFMGCYLWAPISVKPKKFLHLHSFFVTPTIQKER